MGTAVYSRETKEFWCTCWIVYLVPLFVCDSLFLFYSIFLYF